MALTETQIVDSIRTMSAAAEAAALPFNFTRADIRAAISAVDTWATNNAAAYNSALPDPFKSTATAAQKALLLAAICLRRAGQ